MGSGNWSASVFEAQQHYRGQTGASAFAYTDDVMGSTPRSQWRVHPSLDPFGVSVRESRDSDEHPESLPVAVLFDVTGSMRTIPRTLQRKLPDLFGLLVRKGYAAHPQILFGGIGDAACDAAPLQVGQFESDNRMDDDLGNILLEGGGGGQRSESYELAMYFMAYHTALDSLKKRGKRGYLFMIGDEMPYATAKQREIRGVIGDAAAGEKPTPQVARALQRSFEVFHILPEGAGHSGNARIQATWRALFGQNVVTLADPDAVCETIALTIGLCEQAVSLGGALGDLNDVGSTAGGTVGRALAPVARSRGGVVHL